MPMKVDQRTNALNHGANFRQGATLRNLNVDNCCVNIWPVSLTGIEQVVSAQLVPGVFRATRKCLASADRFLCIWRSMSEAGAWKIGKFYNGWHHTTVLHSIEKIEYLRRTDALLDVLTSALSPDLSSANCRDSAPTIGRSALVEAVASRVIDRIDEMQV